MSWKNNQILSSEEKVLLHKRWQSHVNNTDSVSNYYRDRNSSEIENSNSSNTKYFMTG